MGGRPSHLIFLELRKAEVQLRRIRLPRTRVHKGLRRPWLSDEVSVVPLLEEPLPLLEQGSHGHPQGLGQQHRVDLARHVGEASALHLPDELSGDAGPLRELRDAPALRASRPPQGISQHGPIVGIAERAFEPGVRIGPDIVKKVSARGWSAVEAAPNQKPVMTPVGSVAVSRQKPSYHPRLLLDQCQRSRRAIRALGAF